MWKGREQWVYSAWKGRLWGHLIVAFQNLKVAYKEDGK